MMQNVNWSYLGLTDHPPCNSFNTNAHDRYIAQEIHYTPAELLTPQLHKHLQSLGNSETGTRNLLPHILGKPASAGSSLLCLAQAVSRTDHVGQEWFSRGSGVSNFSPLDSP